MPKFRKESASAAAHLRHRFDRLTLLVPQRNGYARDQVAKRLWLGIGNPLGFEHPFRNVPCRQGAFSAPHNVQSATEHGTTLEPLVGLLTANSDGRVNLACFEWILATGI